MRKLAQDGTTEASPHAGKERHSLQLHDIRTGSIPARGEGTHGDNFDDLIGLKHPRTRGRNVQSLRFASPHLEASPHAGKEPQNDL